MNQESKVLSPPGEEASLELNRKISVLKKAMIKEREEKAKELEEIENLKKKLSILEITLSEKESQNQMTWNDKERAEKELYRLRDLIRQSGNPSAVQGARKSVANLEQQNKKLLDEYYFLKQQNVDLKNMISALTQEHQEIQKQLGLKDVQLKKVKSEFKTLLNDALRQQKDLEKSVDDAKTSYTTMLEAQNTLKSDLEEASSNQKIIEDEWQVLNQELLMKQGNIASLNERLLKLSENEAALSSRLMEYKNELVEAEVYYQKHEVTKINQLANYPAVIILKHDHNGNFVLDVEERKAVNTFEVKTIEEIGMNQNSEKRFFIKFFHGQVFDFESANAEIIVKKMIMFLDKAKEEPEQG